MNNKELKEIKKQIKILRRDFYSEYFENQDIEIAIKNNNSIIKCLLFELFAKIVFTRWSLYQIKNNKNLSFNLRTKVEKYYNIIVTLYKFIMNEDILRMIDAFCDN